MDIWNTLAHSEIGTHEMKFREVMSEDDAIRIGKEYCKEKGLIYIGTFSRFEIARAKLDHRLKEIKNIR